MTISPSASLRLITWGTDWEVKRVTTSDTRPGSSSVLVSGSSRGSRIVSLILSSILDLPSFILNLPSSILIFKPLHCRASDLSGVWGQKYKRLYRLNRSKGFTTTPMELGACFKGQIVRPSNQTHEILFRFLH